MDGKRIYSKLESGAFPVAEEILRQATAGEGSGGRSVVSQPAPGAAAARSRATAKPPDST